ncbi:hypothetical protein QRD90_22550 [Peribacillus frigoritolerans]|uniref:hypothetical protein n=1 Tax=Peribacillus frigoritolerans TaxID=450367 RepID=UPI000A46C893|nr:hypothetical protein [Peribacillus frigoritolerans]USK79661.1 hypothetical protein LHV56_22995 [Peribacillus frigoritolerans]WJE46948.1 hypothetical protein QRD90_22550 [Peribacillus frigoritolerans]
MIFETNYWVFMVKLDDFKSYVEEMEQFLIKKHIENQYENDEYQEEDRHFMRSIAV